MSPIVLVLLSNVLYNCLLFGSLWNILLESLDFGLSQLSLYIGILYLSQLLWEIPSGSLSARWGIKKTLFCGQAVSLLGLCFFALWPNFLTLMLFAVAGGFANAMYSDTDTEFMYARLCRLGKAHWFSRLVAVNNSLGFVGLALASFVGALIAENISLTATLWWAIPVLVVHLVLIGFLPSEEVQCQPKNRQHNFDWKRWRQLWRRGNRLRGTLMLSTLIYLVNMVIWYYYQSYGESFQVSLAALGWWAVWMSVAEALPQYVARFFICHPQIRRVYGCCLLLACACVLVASFKLDTMGFVFLLLAVSITGFTFPITESLLRRESRPELWSALAAFKTFASVLLFVLGNLFFGFFAERSGVAAGFFWMAVAVLAMTIFVMFVYDVRSLVNPEAE